MRPHLLRDLRILWRAMQAGSRKAGSDSVGSEKLLLPSPPADEKQLMEEVVDQTSSLSARVLSALCREFAAGQDVSSSSADVPRLDVFHSPLGLPAKMLGVCAIDDVSPGRLLCFYPGRLVVPTFDPGEPEPPRSDKMLTNEYEGVYIDGQGWLPMSLRGHAALGGGGSSDVGGAAEQTLWHGNRLGIGNLLNHPPQGVLPNCVPMIFRWPTWKDLGEDSPARWARLIPHVVVRNGSVVRTASGETAAALAPGQEKVWFPAWPHFGFALFSVRTLHSGDELFWNYRLHARDGRSGYPKWYSPVDEEQFERSVAAELSSNV